MIIQKLNLKNFRNYTDQVVDFKKGINVVYGNNAQGKTNILESIFLCATTKSHRTNNDKEMILYDQPYCRIQLEFEKELGLNRIDYYIKSNEKNSILVNGIGIKKKSELLGKLNVIMFSPEDLGLIKQNPSIRRNFMDSELCQLNPMYFYHLQRYQYYLKQRNNMLKNSTIRKEDKVLFETVDDYLILHGKQIIQLRSDFIEKLNHIVNDIHFDISGKKEYLTIKYGENTSLETYENVLRNSLDNDIRLRNTSKGPHKDDLFFLINEKEVKKYGSQGQHRTAALSLKIAEIELVRKTINEYPVLLLDDVLSELDQYRQQYLMERINNIQTIITCTGIEDILRKNKMEEQTYFLVDQGQIIMQK